VVQVVQHSPLTVLWLGELQTQYLRVVSLQEEHFIHELQIMHPEIQTDVQDYPSNLQQISWWFVCHDISIEPHIT
jgi:hypothetical protein